MKEINPHKLCGTELTIDVLTIEDSEIYLNMLAKQPVHLRFYENSLRDDSLIMNGRTQTTKRDKHTPVTLQRLIMTLEEIFNLG